MLIEEADSPQVERSRHHQLITVSRLRAAGGGVLLRIHEARNPSGGQNALGLLQLLRRLLAGSAIEGANAGCIFEPRRRPVQPGSAILRVIVPGEPPADEFFLVAPARDLGEIVRIKIKQCFVR